MEREEKFVKDQGLYFVKQEVAKLEDGKILFKHVMSQQALGKKKLTSPNIFQLKNGYKEQKIDIVVGDILSGTTNIWMKLQKKKKNENCQSIAVGD